MKTLRRPVTASDVNRLTAKIRAGRWNEIDAGELKNVLRTLSLRVRANETGIEKTSDGPAAVWSSEDARDALGRVRDALTAGKASRPRDLGAGLHKALSDAIAGPLADAAILVMEAQREAEKQRRTAPDPEDARTILRRRLGRERADDIYAGGSRVLNALRKRGTKPTERSIKTYLGRSYRARPGIHVPESFVIDGVRYRTREPTTAEAHLFRDGSVTPHVVRSLREFRVALLRQKKTSGARGRRPKKTVR